MFLDDAGIDLVLFLLLLLSQILFPEQSPPSRAGLDELPESFDHENGAGQSEQPNDHARHDPRELDLAPLLLCPESSVALVIHVPESLADGQLVLLMRGFHT